MITRILLTGVTAGAIAASASATTVYSVQTGPTAINNENDILANAFTGANFGGGDLVVTHNSGVETTFAGNTSFLDNDQVHQPEQVWRGTAGDADFNTLLDNQRWANNSGAQQLDITGLTENTSYLIQFFYADERDCCNSGRSVDITAGSAGSGVGLTLSNNAIEGVDNGQYGVFGFTTGTGDTTASFFVDGGSAGMTGHINAYALALAPTAVPEPTSMLLGAVGLGALAARRRRRG